MYMCRCALKNEVYNNSCYSYSNKWQGILQLSQNPAFATLQAAQTVYEPLEFEFLKRMYENKQNLF